MDKEPLSATEARLRLQYGNLLSLRDIAQELCYPSIAAARKAMYRGTLPVPVVQLPPRRAWFASARAVAEVLDRVDQRDRG